MPAATLDDYRWLIGESAAVWLRRAAEASADPLASLSSLRRDLGPARAALVHEQAVLRGRALRKFAAAERMFFTRRGLEQATDSQIAAYKAGRFPSGNVADLCCGIGGDLVSLAERHGAGQTLGVDRDTVCALFAAANAACRADCGDALDCPLERYTAWHIDPDRRPAGRRTTRVELHEPSAAAIEALLARNDSAAIKLAPAAVLPADWTSRAELEWIGHDRQCQQLVAWFGPLAHRQAERRATLLDVAPQACTFVGAPDIATETATEIGRYLFEPHAAVLAARLGGALAGRHGLGAVSPGVAYFTGDQPIADPHLARFEVLEILPFRISKLKGALAARGAGPLEIKKRGVDVDPEKLRRQLSSGGDQPLAVIVTRRDGRAIAVIARRA